MLIWTEKKKIFFGILIWAPKFYFFTNMNCFTVVKCLNIGTTKNINFPFDTNRKFMVLGVPILKRFKVYFVPFIVLPLARFLPSSASRPSI